MNTDTIKTNEEIYRCVQESYKTLETPQEDLTLNSALNSYRSVINSREKKRLGNVIKIT